MKTQETLPQPSAAGIALKRILVPVDFSPLSKKALQYAMRFAEEFNVDVAIVHVIEPEVPPAGSISRSAAQPNGLCAQRLVRCWSCARRSTSSFD
jgi:hypothetical protein